MQEHGVRSVCPACGSESGWNVHESVLGGLDLDLKKKQPRPSSFGCFALVCKHCQHTMLFAAAPILGKQTDCPLRSRFSDQAANAQRFSLCRIAGEQQDLVRARGDADAAAHAD